VLQRADAFVQRLRDAIDARIRAVLPGDDGAIAAMLIDGKRDAIAPNVYDALFVSGIGHVLSISGYGGGGRAHIFHRPRFLRLDPRTC
jgi:competence protein ComEC